MLLDSNWRTWYNNTKNRSRWVLSSIWYDWITRI